MPPCHAIRLDSGLFHLVWRVCRSGPCSSEHHPLIGTLPNLHLLTAFLSRSPVSCQLGNAWSSNSFRRCSFRLPARQLCFRPLPSLHFCFTLQPLKWTRLRALLHRVIPLQPFRVFFHPFDPICPLAFRPLCHVDPYFLSPLHGPEMIGRDGRIRGIRLRFSRHPTLFLLSSFRSLLFDTFLLLDILQTTWLCI
jgi:hypothetical protein